MAARLSRAHSETVRQKIQASNLIYRLQQCADGDIELTQPQLKAIEMLLDRSVPKLSHIQHSTDPNAPFQVNIVRYTPAE